MKKILVVDDEPAIVTLLKYNLEKEQYDVDVAYDGETAYQKASDRHYDFIILDLMLPKLDGLEVTKRLRADRNKTPIMILTAKDSETDKIVGLELGADDYVTKPFSPREIIARIKAIARRVNDDDHHSTSSKIVVGDITIDTVNYRVNINDTRVQLTPKEFELLVYLAKHAGKTLSRESLLNGVWGFEYPAETRMVDIQISHLRDKIEKDPKHPQYLKTIRGFGYQFEAPTDEQ